MCWNCPISVGMWNWCCSNLCSLKTQHHLPLEAGGLKNYPNEARVKLLIIHTFCGVLLDYTTFLVQLIQSYLSNIYLRGKMPLQSKVCSRNTLSQPEKCITKIRPHIPCKTRTSRTTAVLNPYPHHWEHFGKAELCRILTSYSCF